MGESTKGRGTGGARAQTGLDGTRRRLLRGGLAATPLLTLVSRPVLGSVQCARGSAFDSIPASGQGREQFCSGRSPGYWKQPQHFGEWTPPYIPGTLAQDSEADKKGKPNGAALLAVGLGTSSFNPDATPFNSVFSPSPYADSVTLLDVLEAGGGPPNDVARHIVAALLNAAAGLTPVLEVHEVQNLWFEYSTKGYYEPTAGIKWYHEEIVEYLESTMTQ